MDPGKCVKHSLINIILKSISRKNGPDVNQGMENSPLVTPHDWY